MCTIKRAEALSAVLAAYKITYPDRIMCDNMNSPLNHGQKLVVEWLFDPFGRHGPESSISVSIP